MNYDYKVLNREQDRAAIANLAPEIKARIEEWHKLNIDSIFLNETSATPFGFIFKQAWKEAFPGEKVPKLHRFDPRVITHAEFKTPEDSRQNDERVSKYFTRLVNKDSRVVVFDSDSLRGRQADAVKYELIEIGVAEENIHVDKGYLRVDSSKVPEGASSGKIKALYEPIKIGFVEKEFYRDFYKNRDEMYAIGDVKLRGKILRTASGMAYGDGKIQVSTRDYIHDLKLIGREVGDEILRGKQKQSLEGKVTSAIAIGSLLISILFMSNITGNVIALNGKATNIAGAILFTIGLVASLVYFKRK